MFVDKSPTYGDAWDPIFRQHLEKGDSATQTIKGLYDLEDDERRMDSLDPLSDEV